MTKRISVLAAILWMSSLFLSAGNPVSADTIPQDTVVNYFANWQDTITAFGGRVWLMDDSTKGDIFNNQLSSESDSLLLDEDLADSATGFIPLSIGFHFTRNLFLAPFHVGFKLDPLPAGYSLKDVRIYRRDSAGAWIVERNTEFDTVSKVVSFQVQTISSNSFIAMIDTARPSIRVVSDTGAALSAGNSVRDTFIISDNVRNLTWSFRYASGGASYSSGQTDTGTARNAIDSVYSLISGTYVTQDNGSRAIFIVNDGPHTDTVNVSRRVHRGAGYDVLTTAQMQWTPLRVTAQPDSAGAAQVLNALAQGGVWSYDITSFRLFRWCPYSGNASSTDKWVEYSVPADSLFSFIPGRLIWIKTRAGAVLQSGSAVTTSLKSPCTIAIPAQTWVDIALPYNFPMYIGDIVASTNAHNAGGVAGDSLQYYSWDNSAGQYCSEALYIRDFAGLSGSSPIGNSADSLHPDPGYGYTIYNPLSSTIQLSIPPIPAAMSNAAASLGKNNSSGQGWLLKVSGRTASGAALSSVLCGYAGARQGQSYYPAPPSFNGAAIRVCDGAKKAFGHTIVRGSCATEGGATFLLAFSDTTGNSNGITYRIENLAQLPSNLKAVIIDPVTGALEDASNELFANPPKGQSIYRELAVGTPEYLAKVRTALKTSILGLSAVSLNSSNKTLTISYILPSAGITQVGFAIIDLKGRTVWSEAAACSGKSGPQQMVWDGKSVAGRRAVSGMYVLRMSALDAQRKSAGVFEQKVMYLK